MKTTREMTKALLTGGVVLLLVLTLAGHALAQSCPAGLISWWPGDGNANDVSGVNHGTPQHGATFTSGR